MQQFRPCSNMSGATSASLDGLALPPPFHNSLHLGYLGDIFKEQIVLHKINNIPKYESWGPFYLCDGLRKKVGYRDVPQKNIHI